jgi:hypothetical protein
MFEVVDTLIRVSRRDHLRFPSTYCTAYCGNHQ